MRSKVKVEGRTFEAEVGNVDARPIVVVVEGERFEGWPEQMAAFEPEPCVEDGPASAAARPARPAASPRRVAVAPAMAKPAGRAAAQVRAPIPGAIDSVAVRPGDAVAPGDPLLVVEAMKMKNVIRANRAGTVGEVLVAPGQHVRHDDVLLLFAD
ncbi:MAG: acetyl-CoA carboxylase biotin carboxyl carrier protein subunit [Anaerolineae bacterium]